MEIELKGRFITPQSIIPARITTLRTTTGLGSGEGVSVHFFVSTPNPLEYTDPDGNEYQPHNRATKNKIDRLGTGSRQIFGKENHINDLVRPDYIGNRNKQVEEGGMQVIKPDTREEEALKDIALDNEDLTVYVQEIIYAYQEPASRQGKQTRGTAYVVKDSAGNTLYEYHDVNNDGHFDYEVDSRNAQIRVVPENNPRD